MEGFLAFVIIALIIWLRNSISGEIKSLYAEVKKLQDEIKKMSQSESPKKEQSVADTWSLKVIETIPAPDQTIIPEPEPSPVSQPAVVKTDAGNDQHEEKVTPAVDERRSFAPPPEPRMSFLERYPDIEKFIGENLINKIGIAILVLGIAFFVKYAIDQDWINEIGRVCTGIACGGLLIGIAHRMRNTFKAFSSVLIGGGLAVLYFTISISFHQYHLFNQTAAFAIMVVITAFAVLLSYAYNRIELAVLALIGGFCSPFIVSSGDGNYKILFSYMLILNGGMLALAFRRKWNLLNTLCFIFTAFIFGCWLAFDNLGHENGHYVGAFLFASTFFLIFFFSAIVYNIRHKTTFKPWDIGLVLCNSALYFSSGIAILNYIHKGIFQGLFTLMLALFNFGFAFIFYKKQTIDRNLVFLLIGLVLTFISLAAPIQLNGHSITLFWAAEAVLLLWFSQQAKIRLLSITAVIINLCMMVSLLMDWTSFYADVNVLLPIASNKAFITGIVCCFSLALSMHLLKNEQEENFKWQRLRLRDYTLALQLLGITVVYFVFYLELNYQLSSRVGFLPSKMVSIATYNFLFLVAAFILKKEKNVVHHRAYFGFSLLLLLIHLLFYNQFVIALRYEYKIEHYQGIFFALHLLLNALFVYALLIFNRSGKIILHQNYLTPLKWVTVFFIVYICSAELNHLAGWLVKSPENLYLVNKQISRAGYTVLWGLISLILMQHGMKRKDRMLRIISLSLFFIAILKLFISDIQGLSEAGKIIAFISLGVLLLVVSFMYQRLKKLILQDEEDKKSQSETSP